MLSGPAVVACVLNLIGRTVDLPPIELVDVPPPEVSRKAEAFTRDGSRTIYLVTSSEVFRTAREVHGDCSFHATRKLASVIVHEKWHVDHGRDERGAYEAQLMALRQMGAGPGTPVYAGVHKSMMAALKAQAAAQPADLVATARPAPSP